MESTSSSARPLQGEFHPESPQDPSLSKEHMVSGWTPDDDIMSPNHPKNPMAWPLLKKIYTSASAFLFTFALLNALTSYAAGITPVSQVFGVSMTKATVSFSLFLFGILFAPLYVPHVSERIGRTYIYFFSTITMSVFLLGAAFSTKYTSFAACRFFAGFFGGPIVVNIEGTFADIWSPRHTVTYYSFLAAAQYLGASVGPIILGPVLNATNDWRYTQFVPLIFALAALLLGIGMPETYVREIVRRHARRSGVKHNLPKALSGETVADMTRYTIIDPLIMIVSEPLVIGTALLVGTAFAVTFSLFTTVPSVLHLLYNYTPYTAGLGFLSGLGGSICGAISAIGMEQLARPIYEKKVGMLKSGVVAVEYRLVPAVVGSALMLGSIFWIGFTSAPTMAPIVPITGTAFFVWGSIMVIISTISYIFDAYPRPQSILSALTALAVFRLASGGITSLYFLTGVMKIQGKWTFSIFGFIMIPLLFWPIALFFVGPYLRGRSRFSKGGDHMSPMTMEAEKIERIELSSA